MDNRKLAKKGRFGDTHIRNVGGEKSHVNKIEAEIIDTYGLMGEEVVKDIGSGTINPETGLREYGGWFDAWGKVFGSGNTWEERAAGLVDMAVGHSPVGLTYEYGLGKGGVSGGKTIGETLAETFTGYKSEETIGAQLEEGNIEESSLTHGGNTYKIIKEPQDDGSFKWKVYGGVEGDTSLGDATGYDDLEHAQSALTNLTPPPTPTSYLDYENMSPEEKREVMLDNIIAGAGYGNLTEADIADIQKRIDMMPETFGDEEQREIIDDTYSLATEKAEDVYEANLGQLQEGYGATVAGVTPGQGAGIREEIGGLKKIKKGFDIAGTTRDQGLTSAELTKRGSMQTWEGEAETDVEDYISDIYSSYIPDAGGVTD